MITEMPTDFPADFLAAKTRQMHASPGPVGPEGFAGSIGLQTVKGMVKFLRGL